MATAIHLQANHRFSHVAYEPVVSVAYSDRASSAKALFVHVVIGPVGEHEQLHLCSLFVEAGGAVIVQVLLASVAKEVPDVTTRGPDRLRAVPEEG